MDWPLSAAPPELPLMVRL